MSKLRDFLELMRIPNVFTAQADIMAGFLIAGGLGPDCKNLILLLLCSSLLYSGGMVLNDYFDYSADLSERPERPLPSGRIRKGTALRMGALCLMAGVLLAWFTGPRSGLISLVLAGAILIYDSAAKRNPVFGPVFMGACRYLNLLLGLSVAPLEGIAFLIPALTGLFVVGITVVSRTEADRFDRFSILVGLSITLAILILYFALEKSGFFPEWWGQGSMAIWATIIAASLYSALFERSVTNVRRTVKLMIFGLVGLDGVLVSGVRGPFYALAVWAFLIPAVFVGRKFYST